MNSVEICNMALDAIGTTATISTLDEQSAEAAACSRHYDQTRKELLRLHNWPFARANIALSVLLAREGTPENPDGALDEPEWPWSYAYAYPDDCLKPRYIMNQDTNGGASIDGVPLTTADSAQPLDIMTPTVRFIQGTTVDGDGNRSRVFLTNQYQARLVYTADIEDPDVWDSGFVTALVGRLAQKICIPLTGDKNLLKLAVNAGLQAESEAKAASSNEGITVIDWTPESVAAHGYDDPDRSMLYEGNSAAEIV